MLLKYVIIAAQCPVQGQQKVSTLCPWESLLFVQPQFTVQLFQHKDRSSMALKSLCKISLLFNKGGVAKERLLIL